MNESIGDKIINAVISGGLFQAHDADPRGDVVGHAEMLKFIRGQCGLPEIS